MIYSSADILKKYGLPLCEMQIDIAEREFPRPIGKDEFGRDLWRADYVDKAIARTNSACAIVGRLFKAGKLTAGEAVDELRNLRAMCARAIGKLSGGRG